MPVTIHYFTRPSIQAHNQLAIMDGAKKIIQDHLRNLVSKKIEPNNLYVKIMQEVEVALLEQTMIFTEGNQQEAAKLLGINRTTLRRKLMCQV
jgi:Fis family transcriptional regulator